MKKDYIDAEIEDVNDSPKQEKKNAWEQIKSGFKSAWNQTKTSIDDLIYNVNLSSAFGDKAFEFKIENPEDILFTGDKVYAVLDEDEKYLLFKKSDSILSKVKVNTILSYVNTLNKYKIIKIENDLINYAVMLKGETVSVECYKMLIEKIN